MDGFERRRNKKKNDILEAALVLFMKSGVQKVSIAEIAKQAKVSQVTIYNYYESKDNVIDLVFRLYVDRLWDEMKILISGDLPYEEKIKQMVTFEKDMSYQSMNSKFLTDLMTDYATGQSYVEEIYLKEGLPLLIDFITDGKEQGYIDPALSNEAILFYFQMFQEYLGREDVAPSIFPITGDLTKIFFYGIAGKKED